MGKGLKRIPSIYSILTVRIVQDEKDMTAIAPADFCKVPIAYRELLGPSWPATEKAWRGIW